MNRPQINPQQPLVIDVRYYADNTKTELQLIDFILTEVAANQLTLNTLERSIEQEITRRNQQDKRNAQVKLHKYRFGRFRGPENNGDGLECFALYLSSSRHKCFLTIKENWGYHSC